MSECAECGHPRDRHDHDAETCLICEAIARRDPYFVTCPGFRWPERDE